MAYFFLPHYPKLSSITCLINKTSAVVTDELWIGLNDRKMEGLFDWIDHNTVLFTSWEKGSPKSSGANEDCVLLRGEVLFQTGFACGTASFAFHTTTQAQSFFDKPIIVLSVVMSQND